MKCWTYWTYISISDYKRHDCLLLYNNQNCVGLPLDVHSKICSKASWEPLICKNWVDTINREVVKLFIVLVKERHALLTTTCRSTSTMWEVSEEFLLCEVTHHPRSSAVPATRRRQLLSALRTALLDPVTKSLMLSKQFGSALIIGKIELLVPLLPSNSLLRSRTESNHS